MIYRFKVSPAGRSFAWKHVIYASDAKSGLLEIEDAEFAAALRARMSLDTIVDLDPPPAPETPAAVVERKEKKTHGQRKRLRKHARHARAELPREGLQRVAVGERSGIGDGEGRRERDGAERSAERTEEERREVTG